MARTKKTVFQYLQEATKVEKRSKESMNAFKKRMVEAIDDLPEKVWDGLPDEVQEFANEAIQQINSDNYIPFPGLDDEADEEEVKKPAARAKTSSKKSKEPDEDDDDSKDEGDGEDEEEAPPKKRGRVAVKKEEDDEEEAPPKKRGRPPAVKKTDEEDEAPSKKKAAGRPKGSTTKKKSGERSPREIKKEGSVYNIKMVLLEDVDASAEDIEKILGKRMGSKAPTKSTITGIRSDFLSSLYILKEGGYLKGIDLP